MIVKTWIANEIVLQSSVEYNNPFEEIDVDFIFTCGNKKLKVPAFWDGGKVWKVRFALPKAGTWEYNSICTDKSNAGLAVSGKIECEKYDGGLEIYKHGFVKNRRGVGFFMYNDGTPFFWLGDTHWNFIKEEFDEAGEHAGNIKTSSHFKYIVDKRARQGFTVYQSEPIGAGYNIGNSLDEKDIEGFHDIDRRFQYIASKGLVHANASLEFAKTVFDFPRATDKKYMAKLARYWAARYSAYPVVWTLGQEVDNDFYRARGDQKRFTKETNPFKYFGEALHKNDAYSHPLTAHTEFCTTNPDAVGSCVSNSSFRRVKGHSFYGIQWSKPLNTPMNFAEFYDARLNSEGKACILYESRYDCLWTRHFGARAQGWFAFLNGLYGYGYGAIDIWLYKSTYDMDKTSSDGAEEISIADKATKWCDSVEFESARQVNIMREFLQSLEWWRLVPRFDNSAYYIPDGENYSVTASDEHNTFVLYFYGKNKNTGTLTNLDYTSYTAQWFNPRNGEYGENKEFVPPENRKYCIGEKPDENDWVLLVKKK